MLAPVSPVTHSHFLFSVPRVFSPLHFRSLFRWWCCHAEAGFLTVKNTVRIMCFLRGNPALPHIRII